jgi:hypothetical protein
VFIWKVGEKPSPCYARGLGGALDPFVSNKKKKPLPFFSVHWVPGACSRLLFYPNRTP